MKPCTFSSTPTAPGGKTYPIVPGTCHPGTLGRNAIPGPAFLNTDFSVTKDTKITERLNLQFRAEIFNLLNRANFNLPNAVVFTPSGVSPTAGAITSTSTTARQVQFGLKLLW